MRFLSYHSADGIRPGILVEGRVLDLAKPLRLAGIDPPATLLRYIDNGPRYWEIAGPVLAAADSQRGIPLEDVRLAPPIVPRTIICAGANFDDHLDETHRTRPSHPEFFLKSPTGVIGPGTDVRMDPDLSVKYDYEVELVAIMGLSARHVPAEHALEHVFGWTIINDVSIRDRQIIASDPGRFQIRFGEGKSFLDSAPLGPWIVTPDELADLKELGLRTHVNGVLRQNNSMRNIIWDMPELLAYYSTYMTLEPGFAIASGTPGGPAIGSDLELNANPYARDDGVSRGAYVQSHELVECTIDQIGTLANRYVRMGG